MSTLTQFMGSSGGSSPIGTQARFASHADNITLGDGSVWVRSGISLSAATYPELAAIYPVAGSLIDTSCYTAAINSQTYAYGNGIYVHVGTGSGIRTSTDGLVWGPASNTNAHSVAFGAGRFVAVNVRFSGDAALKIQTSTDGITWNTITLPYTVSPFNSTELRHVIFGGGKFVISEGISGAMWTSTNGTTWSLNQSNPFGTNYRVTGVSNTSPTNGLWFLNNTWIAHSVNGNGIGFFRTSTDLINWTTHTGTLPNTSVRLGFFNGEYVVAFRPVGGAPYSVYSSTSLDLFTYIGSIGDNNYAFFDDEYNQLQTVNGCVILGAHNNTSEVVYITSAHEIKMLQITRNVKQGGVIYPASQSNYTDVSMSTFSKDGNELLVVSDRSGHTSLLNFPAATSTGIVVPYYDTNGTLYIKATKGTA